MKQVLQNLKSGKVEVAEVPPPMLRPGGVLVRTEASLISAGTERASIELGQKSLIGMSLERPDLVRRVFDKFRRDGLWATIGAVRDQLDRDVPLGYSACGHIVEVGGGVRGRTPGQNVALAGAGYACHAEMNFVPAMLTCALPEGVDAEAAAYTTLGAIALQGVRNADLGIGESVVVLGLGLIGQLAMQLIAANGCQPIGFDVSPERVERAQGQGRAELLGNNPAEVVHEATRGRGADAVLITASTKSNEPIELAARLSRDRARIVLVGVTGTKIPRNLYYHKELTFIVSRSYGPGRYDRAYEEAGHDYPIGQVRWTEQRNFEAFLDLVASGKVQPKQCTTHRFAINDALKAFELVLGNQEPHLGVVLTYPETESPAGLQSRVDLRAPARKPTGRIGVSFLGAGNFARTVLLPTLARQADVHFRGVQTPSGISARNAARKFGFAFCASAPEEICNDAETDLVFIATRHAEHAALARQALQAGKAVFVEKPLAINRDQVRLLQEQLGNGAGRLMVGFNRRFSSLALRLKEFLGERGPLQIQYRCNAGRLPDDHWLHDSAQGGRIIGEACHFFDFFAFLTGAAPSSVSAVPAGKSAQGDDAHVTVRYEDGSVGTLLYTSTGSNALSKERIEVFASGRSAVLEDFWRLTLYCDRKRRHWRFRADKGHAAELQATLAAVRAGGAMPIAASSLLQTTLVALAAVEGQRGERPVRPLDLLDESTPGPES